jgi:hypothetical protein
VHRAHLALIAKEALRGCVEVVRAHPERALEALAKRRRERLAVRGQALELDLESADDLLLRKQGGGRRVRAHELRPERVQAIHELVERLGHGERAEPVDPYVEGLAAALGHVSGRGAAYDRQAQPGEPGAHADPPASAQVHGADVRPACAVVDEHTLAA